MKFFIYSALFIIIFLIIYCILLIFNFPLWYGFVFAAISVVLILIIKLFKKDFKKRKKTRFIQEISGESDELKVKFKKKFIKKLKRSDLKQYGDPIYYNPWYLVIGESGTGKTTAIEASGLGSYFDDGSYKTKGSGPTKDFEWYFFENAIIIDTAGRLTKHEDQTRDEKDWNNFINILAKYRKKEPVNGVIVCVSAKKLINQSEYESLKADAQEIKVRITSVMNKLGAKFPIYILITFCDKIPGMIQFCEQLDKEELNQAMGSLNHEYKLKIGEFQQKTMEDLGNRLRDIRITEIQNIDTKQDPGLLILPNEFSKIDRGLSFFLDIIFQKTKYEENPSLRGIFFSSGKQESFPHSDFLESLGFIETKDAPKSNQGFFLRDFFLKILPSDRELYSPTYKAKESKKRLKNYLISGYYFVMLCILSLLGFSFIINTQTLNKAKTPPELNQNINENLYEMERYLNTIVDVEKQNSNWWIPRLGLNTSSGVEHALKKYYCATIKREFIDTFDKYFQNKMTSFNEYTDGNTVGPYIANIIRRINVIKAYFENKSVEVIQSMPQPSYSMDMIINNKPLIPELEKKFAHLYSYYLIWNPDQEKLREELDYLQELLKHLLTEKIGNLRWTVRWIEAKKNLKPIILDDFLGKNLKNINNNDISLSQAFTIKGREHIELFLKEIESAFDNEFIIAELKEYFFGCNGWYHNMYIKKWENFANQFHNQVKTRLKNREDWLDIIKSIGHKKGPYLQLLKRIASEFKPFFNQCSNNLPEWILLADKIQNVIMQANSINSTEKGIIKRTADKLLSKTKTGINTSSLSNNFKAANAYKKYDEQFSLITKELTGYYYIESYNLSKNAYQESLFKKSKFYTVHYEINNLQRLIGGYGRNISWKLFNSPLDLCKSFVNNETACYLQQKWEEEILSAIPQEVPDSKEKSERIVELVKKFTSGTAKPFIKQTSFGIFSKNSPLMGKIDLNQSSLQYILTVSKYKSVPPQKYSVEIECLPIEHNQTASVYPNATRLELLCEGQNFVLENKNYIDSKIFIWESQHCSDVTLYIEISELNLSFNNDKALKKTYQGSNGFKNFLNEFENGRKTFRPRDFPLYKQKLRAANLNEIHINYNIYGDFKKVIKFTKAVPIPGTLPEDFAPCWE